MNATFPSSLLTGERVLWNGRPTQGLLFTAEDLFLIPFSLLWCGFAISTTFGANHARTPLFFTLWGGMFVALGFFFVAGRFMLDIWLRRRIYYAVTNQRVMIVREGPFPSFTAIQLERLPEVRFTGNRQGRGTLRFGGTNMPFQRMNSWTPALSTTPQFLGIDNAGQVFDVIMEAANKARTSPSSAD
jgi:hypothetical protein